MKNLALTTFIIFTLINMGSVNQSYANGLANVDQLNNFKQEVCQNIKQDPCPLQTQLEKYIGTLQGEYNTRASVKPSSNSLLSRCMKMMKKNKWSDVYLQSGFKNIAYTSESRKKGHKILNDLELLKNGASGRLKSDLQKIYNEMRDQLNGLNLSFVREITSNSTFCDKTQQGSTQVHGAYKDINPRALATWQRLCVPKSWHANGAKEASLPSNPNNTVITNNSIQDEIYSQINDIQKEVASCLAAISLTRKRYHNYKNNGDKLSAADSAGKNFQSVDGQLKCTDSAAQSVDFKSCSNAVHSYSATIIAQKAEIDGTRILIQKAQTEATLNMDPEDPAAQLRAQLEVVNKTKNVKTAMALVATTRAGALSVWGGERFPSAQEIVKACKKDLEKTNQFIEISENYLIPPYQENLSNIRDDHASNYQLLFNGINNSTSLVTPDPDIVCSNTAGQLELITNAQNVNKAKALRNKALAEAAVQGAEAIVLGQTARKIEDAIRKLEDATEDMEDTSLFADGLIFKCTADPTLEGCSELGFTAGLDFASSGLNVGGNGETGISAGTPIDTATNSSAKAIDIDAQKIADIKTFSESDDIARGPAEFANRPPAAAKVKKGSRKFGGSSSAPSGSAANGGNSVANNNASNRSQSANGNSRKWQFNKPAKFEIRTTGGSGDIASNSGRSKNPLTGLLNKNAQSDIQHFRTPATIGDKGNSLFDQISNRYSEVSNKNRLEVYEVVELF